MNLLYGALLIGAVILGWKLWVFLSREDVKHRADVEQKLQVARVDRAHQRVEELYRRFCSEMEGNPAHVPFLGLLDAAHHGTVEEMEHAYGVYSELPLQVVHKLQQLHEAKAAYLSLTPDTDE